MRAIIWSIIWSIIVMFNTWLAAPAAAQEKPQPENEKQGPVAAATFVDYRVGPADQLEIKVFGLDTLDQQTRVSNSGKIHIPYVGVLAVNDMTTSQIEAEIARRLREAAIINEPWVQVRVTEYRARPVYLLGEVWTPGQFMITGHMTVLDLLTLGNGTSFNTAMGFLYRRKIRDTEPGPGEEPIPTDEAIPIDFEALAEGRQANLELQGGDVLYVPLRKPEMFYVVGAVQRPGALEIQPRQPLLVSQAIAMAGGLMKTAKTKDGMVLRYDEDGTRREMPIDVTAVLRGKAPDFPVQADDIIFVPGSMTKNIGYSLLNLAPMAVSRVIVPF
jgi:polysaccharide export outer membrane protein